jgi:hypothetical protein
VLIFSLFATKLRHIPSHHAQHTTETKQHIIISHTKYYYTPPPTSPPCDMIYLTIRFTQQTNIHVSSVVSSKWHNTFTTYLPTICYSNRMHSNCISVTSSYGKTHSYRNTWDTWYDVVAVQYEHWSLVLPISLKSVRCERFGKHLHPSIVQ